ncbi:hypothetical protein CQA53_11955 [Helicobacter didelphidarum]|uniref:Uncharacterized protein n=1 Tax=Helicobacter didelphidarum TaxID=2040648 RepID=A0A3D8I0S7_9HELI|nr:hypothetical protein CQA53_11955 [Helicobacter didelphidarum]
MYFSYGGDMIGLQESSRHSNDINLHIKTQGYSDGEEVEIELETSANEIIVTRAIIQNNQAIIKNIKIREER